MQFLSLSILSTYSLNENDCENPSDWRQTNDSWRHYGLRSMAYIPHTAFKDASDSTCPIGKTNGVAILLWNERRKESKKSFYFVRSLALRQNKSKLNITKDKNRSESRATLLVHCWRGKREHFLTALEHESYKSDEVLAQKLEGREQERKNVEEETREADTVFKASNGLDNFSCFPLSFPSSLFSLSLSLFIPLTHLLSLSFYLIHPRTFFCMRCDCVWRSRAHVKLSSDFAIAYICWRHWKNIIYHRKFIIRVISWVASLQR